MKRTIASIAFCSLFIAASAQTYEPQFNSEIRILSVNAADTTVHNPEVAFGTIKTKKKGSLFGKIAKGAALAGSAATGIGAASGNVGTVLTGLRTASAASSAADISDAVDAVAGKALITTSFSLKNPTSSCVLPSSGETILIVRMADNSENPAKLMQILPLEAKKKERLYNIAEVKDDSAAVMNNTIPFSGEKYGESSYLIRFNAPAGEYAVTLGEENLMMHCFSIAD